MKRLKNRLDRLTTAAGDEITRADQQLLVSILGRRDALFWPWRWTIAIKPPMAEIRRRQAEHLDGTVGIAAKADGRGQWKDLHAARQRLIAAGLVTATHSSGQVQSLFITPKGESLARGLVGSRLHDVESGMLIFAYLVVKGRQSKCKAIRESVLFCRPCTGSPGDWDEMTEMVLPFLTCGMVRQDSDTQGRAVYAPVDGVAPPEVVELQASAHADFDDLYIESFNSERHVLSTCEPRDPHELYIPLPASGDLPHFQEVVTDENV